MSDLLVYCLVLALYILFCCNTHVQWNLDITSLYITKSFDITNDFMKKNLDIAKKICQSLGPS